MTHPELSLLAFGSAWFLLGYLNAAEAAFLRVRDVRVRHRAEGGDRRSAFLVRQLDERERFLSFVVLCSKLSACLLALVLYRVVYLYWDSPLWLCLVILSAMGFLVLTAQRFPAALGFRYADRLAAPLVWPLRILERFPLSGLADLLGSLVKSTGRWLGSPVAGVEPGFRFDELRTLLEASEERGVLDPASNRMVQACLRLGEVSVRIAMLPIDDVIMVPDDETLDRVLRIAGETGYSRLPLYRGEREKVVGYVHSRDLLVAAHRDPSRPVASIRQEILEVSPDASLLAALRLFRSSRYHMAVVREASGRALGVITIEDVLERIVGAIEDEHDDPSGMLQDLGGGSWRVDPEIELEELKRATGLAVPAGEYRTLGGFLVAGHGRPPAQGTETLVSGYRLVVEASDDLVVKRVRVERVPEGTGKDPSGTS